MTLYWLAEKGEHYYTIKTCSIVGGQEFMEDVDSVSCHVDVENLEGTAEDVWITIFTLLAAKFTIKAVLIV